MPPSGGGQLYPASWDMTTPFPFGCLPAVPWDINPKEMGSLGAMEPAVGDGACRRGYGRPERERLHMTSLFLLWLLLRPIPFRVPASGSIIWHSLASAPPDPLPGSGLR